MKASELREKSADDLNQQLLELRKQQLSLRMQAATGQLGETHRVRQLRRDVARVKTVLAEKAGEL